MKSYMRVTCRYDDAGEPQAHMLEIKFMLYNDIQVQTSLRISQTMEAGLT
jgi:hypothetical protein